MKLYLLYLMPLLWYSGTDSVFSSSFEGLVTDPDLRPLVGATVELEREDHVQTIATNEHGHFQFLDLSPETYQITVSHLGYETLALSKEISGKTEHHFVLYPAAIILESVQVEDHFRKQRRKEEMLTVEVVGADFVRTHDSGSLMHTLRRLPGVQAVHVGSGQSKPLIRGLGFNRIVVAKNGIKHEGQQWGADHALEIDQFAIDQAELIKGPGSLVYGSDAIGGVIRLSQRQTAAPGSLSANVHMLGRSSNQLLGTSASVEGRRRQWSFSSRITWLDYADTRVPVDSVDVYSYRVPLYKNRLRNTAGDELNLHFSLGYTGDIMNSRLFISQVQQKAGFFANAHGLEPRRVDTDLYDRSDRDILYPLQDASHLKLVNRTIVDFGKTMLISETGYQRNDREELSQYVNHGYMPPVFPDTLPMPSDLERSFEKHTVSANVRLQHQPREAHQLTVGLSAEHQDNRIGGISFLMPAFKQWLLGAYLLHEWQVKSDLRMSAGLRYDHGLLSTQAYYDWFPTNGNFLQRAAALNRDYGSFSGMIGINYHSGNAIVRANLGRSFRVPLAKELAANGVNYHHFSYEVGDASLKPEIAWQLDLGVEYATTAWSFRISPFMSYFPNYIYLNPSHLFDFDHGAGNQIFNYTASEVFRLGGEITIIGEILDNLMFEFSAEYAYSEQLSGDKKGFSIPFAPPASFLAGLSWNPFENSDRGSLQHLTIIVDSRVTAAQNRIVPPERKTPGYQTFNTGLYGVLMINGMAANWRLMVNNLFNTHYMEHTSYYRLIGVPEPGRNTSVSLIIPVQIIKSKNE